MPRFFCLIVLLCLLSTAQAAEPDPTLAAMNMKTVYRASSNGAGQVLVSGVVVNLGETPIRHVRLRARLMDGVGREIGVIEQTPELGTVRSFLRFSSAPRQGRSRGKGWLAALQSSLPAHHRLSFEFNFNDVDARTARVTVAVLYSPGYLSTPVRVHTLYESVLPGVSEPADTADSSSVPEVPIWEVVRLGMNVSQVKKALARSRQSPYRHVGIERAMGTIFIESYVAGDGELRLHFHEGRLFSIKSRLPDSPDSQRRQANLQWLKRYFQGMVISKNGSSYKAEPEVNTYEFFGKSRDGWEVETQGNWLLIYLRDVTIEVRRKEYQGR